MNTIRYLTFEINRACGNGTLHAARCPNAHPERYRYSASAIEITDAAIVNFWRWCREKGFRGLVLWHMYNEPVLVMARIRRLMEFMLAEDRYQPFQLTTSIPGEYPGFDIVKVSDYTDGVARMDNRLATNTGCGKPYTEMPQQGWCARGLGWEIPIDNFGNWCLCCGDWRCEEAVGSIVIDEPEILYHRWMRKRKTIRWHDEASYLSLPRLCRACLDKNPTLSSKGGI